MCELLLRIIQKVLFSHCGFSLELHVFGLLFFFTAFKQGMKTTGVDESKIRGVRLPFLDRDIEFSGESHSNSKGDNCRGILKWKHLYNKINVFNENFYTNHESCTRVDKRNIEFYEHSVLLIFLEMLEFAKFFVWWDGFIFQQWVKPAWFMTLGVIRGSTTNSWTKNGRSLTNFPPTDNLCTSGTTPTKSFPGNN